MAAGWAGERSDRYGFLHFGGVSGRTGLRHDRVAELLGAWYEESSQATGHGYADWFVPATIEVVEILLALEDLDAALVSLGAARAHRGYTQIDALTDLAVLADVAPGRLRARVEAAEASAALAAGFDSVGAASFAPKSRIAGCRALSEVVESNQRSRTGMPAAEALAVVVVDVSPSEGEPVTPGVAVHVTAAETEMHFPLADPLFWLRGGRFAVLAWRHPGLAQSVAELEAALTCRGELDGADANVWVEAVPGPLVDPQAWVERLALMEPPTSDARDVRVAAVLVDTPRAHHALGGPRRGFGALARIQQVWNQGLSLVTTAAAVLLVASGLARAVGPFEHEGGRADRFVLGDVPSELPSSDQLAAGRPATALVAPVANAQGEVPDAPQFTVDPQPVVHVQPSQPDSASPPASGPDQTRAQPEREPGPTSVSPDPCRGLDGGRAVACERHQEVGPPGQDQDRDDPPRGDEDDDAEVEASGGYDDDDRDRGEGRGRAKRGD